MTNNLELLPQNLIFQASLRLSSFGVQKNRKIIRKNFRTGQSFIGTPDKEQALKTELNIKLSKTKALGKIDQNTMLPIQSYVNCQFIFFYPKKKFFTKKGERNKKLADLSNLYEMPQDALTRVGIIKDDHLIDSHDGSIRTYHDKDFHQLVIKISLKEK